VTATEADLVATALGLRAPRHTCTGAAPPLPHLDWAGVVAVDMPLVWQGAAHMADGYSRVSGRHGVCGATVAARHATAQYSA
jgi:hypothetical protein